MTQDRHNNRCTTLELRQAQYLVLIYEVGQTIELMYDVRQTL